MIECFDWLSKSVEDFNKMITDIVDFDFLDILEDIEADGQNRDSIFKNLGRYRNLLKLDLEGFSLNILDLLLNHPPLYVKGKVKEDFDSEMRGFIYKRDGYKCRLCHCDWHGLICHHIVPQGSADESNLITLCGRCHDAIHRLLKNKGYPYHIPVRPSWY